MLRIPMIMFCSVAIIATLLTAFALWPEKSQHNIEAKALTAQTIKIQAPPEESASDPAAIISKDARISPPQSRPSVARKERRDSKGTRTLPKRIDAAPDDISTVLPPPISAPASAAEPLPLERVQPAPALLRKAFDPPLIAPSRPVETISPTDRDFSEPRREKQVSRAEEARDAMRDIRPR